MVEQVSIWRELILIVAGGGTMAAFLKFIEFLVSHRTHKQERKEDKAENLDKLREELKDHLEDTNAAWKEMYCDKNSEAIEELRKALTTLAENSSKRAQYEHYMGESLVALTHDKLVHLGKTYQRRGGITLSEQANLTMLYKPYHEGLGGNHDGETWYNYCMKDLKVISEQEAMELDKARR